MNDSEILKRLIEELIKKNICPDSIDLKDRAAEHGEDYCKRKYCPGCWSDALKTIDN